MEKVLRHFMIFFLLALVGLSCLFPAEVFADRSFQVPEVQEDFGRVDQAPQPQEKTESIQQNTKEENGTWDWIKKSVSDGWKWAEEKISAAKEWTKENAPAFWEAIEKFLSLLTSIVIVPVYFFKGEIKVIVDLFKDIWDLFNHPVENLKNLLYAVSHPIETGKAIWQAISESWMRDVVNGDAKSRAEWLGYATGQIVLAIVGTKGADKAAKLAKGSKVAQSARRRLTDRLPAPAQKFFSKDGWRNMAEFYLRGQKINWKNTLITGATGISLLGIGVFGVPKIVKIIKKIDIDCSFASHQFTDSYLAAMLLPDLNCDFSYGKDGTDAPKNTKVDQYTIKVKTPKPLEPRGQSLNRLPEFKQEEIALKTYDKLRSTGLNKQEIDTFAKNTGLSVEEAIQLKSHIFLTKHANLADWKNGKYYYEGYFDPDIHIAYGWEQALKRELTAEEKAWFRQLADHELSESKLMQEGMPYRDLRSFVKGKGLTKNPPGAHDKAPKQPQEFPGFEPKIF